MLRRVLVVTGMALVGGAACAYAVSPRVAHMSRSLTRGFLGLERGFTPAPPDSSKYATEGGVPGTYCPTPSRDSSAYSHKSPSEPGLLDSPAAQSVAPVAKSGDSLLAPAQAKCDIPAASEPSKLLVPR